MPLPRTADECRNCLSYRVRTEMPHDTVRDGSGLVLRQFGGFEFDIGEYQFRTVELAVEFLIEHFGEPLSNMNIGPIPSQFAHATVTDVDCIQDWGMGYRIGVRMRERADNRRPVRLPADTLQDAHPFRPMDSSHGQWTAPAPVSAPPEPELPKQPFERRRALRIS